MAKQEQVLQLEPASELHFVGPFTEVVTSTLKLMNPIDKRVCFKVKTTAPKKYCVRPNSGVLEPKEVISVAVMLQPFDYNPNEKNKHKFMVQTVIVPDGDISIENLWRDASSDSLMDSKLRCVFDMPDSENLENINLDTNLVQSEDKTAANKIVADASVKSSPKVSNYELEVKKVTEENRRLKDEILRMKKENAQLKDEGLRLRKSGIPSTDTSSQGNVPKISPPLDSQLQEQPQSPMLYLAVMLTVGLLGIFLGKFVV